MRLYVFSKSGVSVSPSPLRKSCNQALLAFKAKILWALHLLLDLRLGSLTWGSELSLLWDSFCGIIIFWFVGGPSGAYGSRFYHDSTPLTRFLWLLLFLDAGYFLGGGRFQHFWLLVVQQL